MPDRIFHGNLLGAAAILEEHLDGVGNRAFVGVQIFFGVIARARPIGVERVKRARFARP